MKVFGKLLRGVLYSRTKLYLISITMAMLLLYTFSCELNISGNCQSIVQDNHLLPAKSVFIREGLKLNDVPPTHSDIIPPGGTYYRSTPLNRTKVEQYVNWIVQDIQVKKTKGKKRLVDENRLRLERQMDSNLEEIELENWKLENYHMPRTQKISIPKPILKQEPQNIRTIPTLKVPGSVQKLTKTVPQENIVPVYMLPKQPQPMEELTLMVDKKLEESNDELLGMDTLEVTGPDSYDEDAVESKHENLEQELEIKEPVLKQQVDPKPKRKIFVNGDGLSQHINPNPNPNMLHVYRHPPGDNPVVKKSKKAMKIKKKQNKLIPNLPHSFLDFDTSYPPGKIGTYTCSNSLCSEFLTNKDMSFYKLSVTRFKMSDNFKGKNHAFGECHFMNGRSRSAVALASFPGSGNTWARGLLERATGVCTGSIYSDNALRAAGMNGECVRSGAVIAVKTHKSNPVSWTAEDKPSMAASNTDPKKPAYGSAILVVRNPFHALVAEWSRLAGKSHDHTSQLSRDYFVSNPNWNSFIKRKLSVWQSYFKHWVVGGANHRVMVVRFEDIKMDVVGTVTKMLDFLKFSYNDKELARKLSEDFGTFKRKHKDDQFDHFTEDQKFIVRNAISKSVDYLRENNHGNTLGIEDYLN